MLSKHATRSKIKVEIRRKDKDQVKPHVMEGFKLFKDAPVERDNQEGMALEENYPGIIGVQRKRDTMRASRNTRMSKHHRFGM